MEEVAGGAAPGKGLAELWRQWSGHLRVSWWLVAGPALIGAVVGLGFALLQTPIYRATAVLYVTSGTTANAQNAYQGSLASEQRVSSYSRLATSEAVAEDAIEHGAISLSAARLRSSISSTSIPDTALFTVSAKSEDARTAATLANAVSASLTRYVATLETPGDGQTALAKATVVTPANAPSKPASPSYQRYALVGFLLGVVGGILLLLLRVRLDTRVRSEQDVQTVVDAPVLGSVPQDDALNARSVLDFSLGTSAAGESYRRIRTNLSFINVDTPITCLLVSSAVAGEGKTTTALNLAACFAEDGRRVLLLEADLRRPTVADRLGVSSEVGFTSCLMGDVNPLDVVQPSGTPNLDVLVCGPLPPNPAELLGSQKAQRLVKGLEREYDLVVIDSTPILPVADASICSRFCNGVLLVSRFGVTRRPALAAAASQIQSVHARFAGTILNGASFVNSEYGYGVGYYRAEPVAERNPV
ncbi:MAG: polysaccharide biosynthesis tyrosine autokinase [Gordonia sp. (in: high G+C Gram-positive bacteria)]